MICSHCRADNPTDAEFCENCGSALPKREPRSTGQTFVNLVLSLTLGLLAISCGLFGGCLFVMGAFGGGRSAFLEVAFLLLVGGACIALMWFLFKTASDLWK